MMMFLMDWYMRRLQRKLKKADTHLWFLRSMYRQTKRSHYTDLYLDRLVLEIKETEYLVHRTHSRLIALALQTP